MDIYFPLGIFAMLVFGLWLLFEGHQFFSPNAKWLTAFDGRFFLFSVVALCCVGVILMAGFWALSFQTLSPLGVWTMGVVVLVLVCALVYTLKKGALAWGLRLVREMRA